MRQTISRYQSRLWKYFRNLFLIVGTYFSGLIALELAFPLVLWLALEAMLRYFPKWLQICTLAFLGLQIDWWLQWPLGLGLAFVTLIWALLMVGQSLKQNELFFLWHMAIFFTFLMIMNALIPAVRGVALLIQMSVYMGTLLVRLYTGKRT